MQESKREKRLRFLLIGLCLLVVLGGFLYSSNSSKKVDGKTSSIQAEVLSKGSETENPVIAVAKMVEEQPVLVIYELDRNNQFFFKVLHSVSLQNTVKTMSIAKEHNGIWVQLEEKNWVLFSESLEVLQEREDGPSSVTTSRHPFNIEEDGFIGIPRDEGESLRLNLSNRSGKPNDIHSLSVDDSIWMVVFQKDLVLARSQ
ncbi:hypothetical protein LCL96_00665 [Rossellomorea aquimaris]|uniref:hypothetical protein n=1 Tax=Rossellomorea TaxID=2837508 RepID=UPI001CD20F13|nr:hypothetical protein [Rossellomorea aquimaris]MCA1057426.1 hypothetical protein [Rossellomorea aquimaris]